MPLRIACDVDGTLADMDSALQRQAEQLFGSGVVVRAVAQPLDAEPPHDPPEAVSDDSGQKRPLTRPEMRQLWDHVRTIENFWTTLEEIEPGVIARLAALARMHAWEVLFVTQRPTTEGETSQLQTQRWLEAHGFELPSVYVMNGSRGTLAAALALDAVIDDRRENVLDVKADSTARAVLVGRGTVPPGAAGLGIDVVPTFAAALDLLEQMTVKRTTPPRLVDRVRAAIGW